MFCFLIVCLSSFVVSTALLCTCFKLLFLVPQVRFQRIYGFSLRRSFCSENRDFTIWKFWKFATVTVIVWAQLLFFTTFSSERILWSTYISNFIRIVWTFWSIVPRLSANIFLWPPFIINVVAIYSKWQIWACAKSTLWWTHYTRKVPDKDVFINVYSTWL